MPQWFNADMGKGYQCECGCTSIEVFEGRPYGPRSVHWPELVKEFEESYPVWDHPEERAWYLSTVVVG
jgi:hypothetical protein